MEKLMGSVMKAKGGAESPADDDVDVADDDDLDDDDDDDDDNDSGSDDTVETLADGGALSARAGYDSLACDSFTKNGDDCCGGPGDTEGSSASGPSEPSSAVEGTEERRRREDDSRGTRTGVGAEETLTGVRTVCDTIPAPRL